MILPNSILTILDAFRIRFFKSHALSLWQKYEKNTQSSFQVISRFLWPPIETGNILVYFFTHFLNNVHFILPLSIAKVTVGKQFLQKNQGNN